MKHINNFIVERLILSKTRHSGGMTCTPKDFLGDIIIEPIKDVMNRFEAVSDRLSYYNVIKDGVIIGAIEKNTNLYFNLIVSSATYENIMGDKCIPSDTDYLDLPANIQKNINNHDFIFKLG
jgi:hypothetical protein